MPVILTRRDPAVGASLASTVLNDSTIPGASVKDALEFLDGDKVSYNFENNTISGTGDIHAGSYFGDGSTLSGIDHDLLINFTATEHFTEASIDHGAIAGLGGDDHSQYHNNTRGDVRYYQKSEVDSISGALSTEIDNDITTHTAITSAHHTKYTNEEAQDTIGAITSGAGTVIVTYDDDANTLTISGSPHTVSAGEINTASNLVGDQGIFASKSGVDLRFKSLTAGENITLTADGNAITISGGAGVIAHGGLTGLSADDHSQYSLADGTRAFIGDVSINEGKELRWYDVGTSNYVGFEAPALSANQIWVLPDADGSTGEQLTTDGTGTLTWSGAGGGGGGGVTDHGALTGLSDDDHSGIYHSIADITTISGDLQVNIDALTHDGFADFVDAEHIDHTTVSISSSGILSGGGTIDGNQTITLANADIDHGGIGGLSDDDHSKYPLVTGLRGFTGVVPGITPTASTHLTTKSYVDSLVQGLDWQDSVLSLSGCTPPGGPSTGDRYIVCSTSGVGDWNGMEDYVVEWNGTTWTGSAPNEGFASWIEDEDVLYVYSGTAWVKFGSTVTHNNTVGKQGGNGSDEFYHFNVADHTALISANRDETIADSVGTMVTGNTETHITVTYEDGDNTLDFVVNTADTTGTIGAATFDSDGFDVTGGLVTISTTGSGVASTYAGDTGTASPAAGVITFAGGEGIDTSATGSSVSLSVNVDGSTIEINADTLRVKDDGVTEVKLNIFNTPSISGVLGYTTNGMEWIDIDTDIDVVTETDIKLENESANCNGATTVFTLDFTPVANSIQVFLNGLIQEKGSGKDYTHSGTSITFVVAPLTGDILIIHYIVNN